VCTGNILLIDAYLPGMNGLDMLRHLRERGDAIPAIMITGNSDVSMAVQAMKAGAADFIEKPVSASEMLASIKHALAHARESVRRLDWTQAAASQIAGLTARQRKIMAMVMAGHPSKNIAADLGISQRPWRITALRSCTRRVRDPWVVSRGVV
jgi:two-component system CheB/CheR fusion protein